MRQGCWLWTTCCLAIACCGCESRHPAPQSSPQPATAQELIGKWRLVKAGGQLPSAMNIKSLQIDIAADGTWVSEIEMQGQFAGPDEQDDQKLDRYSGSMLWKVPQ